MLPVPYSKRFAPEALAEGSGPRADSARAATKSDRKANHFEMYDDDRFEDCCWDACFTANLGAVGLLLACFCEC
jgi:hypothetical protein